MSVQSPPGVCGVVLEGAANTGTGQTSGKSGRVRLFKGLILFSQGFAGVGKNTYPLSVSLPVRKRLVLWVVLKIKPIYTHCGILGRKMLEKCEVLITPCWLAVLHRSGITP